MVARTEGTGEVGLGGGVFLVLGVQKNVEVNNKLTRPNCKVSQLLFGADVGFFVR